MADQATNTTTNDNLLSTYFERKLIANLKEKVYFYQVATKFPLPKGEGKSITFNGWRKLGAASSTLSEGSANSTVNLSSRKVTATIAQYGRAVKVTDLLDLTSISSPSQAAVTELSHAAALTLDNAVQLAVFKNVIAQVGKNADTKAKILSAWMSTTASAFSADTGTDNNSNQFGVPVVFGTSAARLSAVSKAAPSISAKLGPIVCNKTIAQLRGLDADPMANGRYVAIASPKALATMYSNPDYKQWYLSYKEGPKETQFKHITTTVHNIEFMESSNVPRYAVAAHSVNLTAVFGKDAVAITELDGGIKVYVKRPGPQSTNDPFNQNTIISFKMNAVGALLNPSAARIMMTHEKL